MGGKNAILERLCYNAVRQDVIEDRGCFTSENRHRCTAMEALLPCNIYAFTVQYRHSYDVTEAHLRGGGNAVVAHRNKKSVCLWKIFPQQTDFFTLNDHKTLQKTNPPRLSAPADADCLIQLPLFF